MKTDPKIDFVVTWVDGNDPAWQAEKARYSPDTQRADNAAIRYREWDLLRYWFRAVETYAPWVGTVHFVTWGHVPAWLNTDCPRLHIVRHEDYIPEQYLPTFSSHPIELNMHRIPGLSEQFVYFNDDFYLTAPVQPEDFFVDGLPCDSLEETPLDLSWRTIMNYINANDILYINEHFVKTDCRKENRSKWFSLADPFVAAKNGMFSLLGRKRFFGLNYHHLPQAFRKETFEAAWEQGSGWLDETCCRKFRDYRDISPHVFQFWQLASGAFHPYSKRRFGIYFPGGTDPEKAAAVIRGKTVKCMCYNDSDKVDFRSAQKILQEAFESVLPEKSAFER